MAELTESVEMRAALLRLRRSTGLEVAFGGLLHDGRAGGGRVDGGRAGRDGREGRDGRRLRIAELNGAVTPALRGLSISAGSGLGGKCLALSRPCAVVDYPSARHITHEYDGPVSAEGLRSVIAVPIVVRRQVRGVLYGALRDALPLGDRVFDAAVAAARDVEQALAVRDEARDHVRELLAEGPSAEIREAHGDLRALVPQVTDPDVRARLLEVCARLEAATAGPVRRPAGVALTPRELDVLVAVASGATNATAADRLGLRPETVKGYLRSTMRKLGAHTRGEAVVAARRAGLLP
ncbi:LuxR C-terminal-related transcriptional regulator [Streptomyces sp. NPDC001927]